MKNFKNIYLLAGALALCSVGFVSCDDDDEYDFPGDSRNRVYTADHSTTYKLVQTPAGAMGSFECKIPAKCNKVASGDIKVTLEVDNSLIDEYNAQHGTSFLPMPDEAITIENPVMTIPAGQMVSADTTKISLVDNQDILLTLTASEGYILPVRMTTVNGGDGAPATSVKSTSFLTMSIINDAVNHGATLSDATGTPVADRSGWSVTGNVNIGDYSKYFDDDPKNKFTLYSDSDIELIFDMGQEYTFDAIEAKYGSGWGSWVSYYGSFSDDTTISISSDKTKWTSVGAIENAGWKGAEYVVFWGPLTARYIKLNIPATEGYDGPEASFQCGYFNVYAK